MIDKYFGGPEVVFYITFVYGLSSNLVRMYLLWYGSRTKTSQARQMRDMVVYGAALVSVTMLLYPVSMALIGTENSTLGFSVGIILTIFMGLWVFLLMNHGFNLMSLATEKSASFFHLGQTATGIITWPLLLLLRFGVEKAGGGDNTDINVAALSFPAIAVLGAGCIPLYLFITRHLDSEYGRGEDACRNTVLAHGSERKIRRNTYRDRFEVHLAMFIGCEKILSIDGFFTVHSA